MVNFSIFNTILNKLTELGGTFSQLLVCTSTLAW